MPAESINNFFAVSLNYKKADTKIRGKFSFFPEMVEEFSYNIKKQLPETCAYILSTCNRTEIYTQTENIEAVISIFCDIIKVSPEEFELYTNIHNGQTALVHFLRVSSGLESQILGDFEIISQIKIWFRRFKEYNLTSSFLERLINTGIQASKKIKNTTALSSGVTSMSYVPVHYLLTNIPDLSNKKIVLAGLGKIGTNTCENLIKHIETPKITLINRTLEKAKEAAEKFNLNYTDYSELHSEINNADIVITATHAMQPIIKKQHIISKKKIIFIDLSVPENISEEVKNLKNITLLNVDKLSQVINSTLETRNKEIPKAENIIEEILEEFTLWAENRKYVPIIHAFKSDLERIKDCQIKNMVKDQIIVDEKENILSDKLVQKITNRLAGYLMNHPENAENTMSLFKEIFQLKTAANL